MEASIFIFITNFINFYFVTKNIHFLNLEIVLGEAVKFREIAVKGKGSSFGELALLYRKPRAATITTKSNCIFAVLDKNLYQKVLGK